MSDAYRSAVPTWECLDLVGACSIGRLCFIDRDTPIAHPVSFKLHRGDAASSIVVRTGPDSLLGNYAGPASFEVDEIDVAARSAWSVLMRGTVRRIHEPRELPAPEPWISDGRHVWLMLDITSVSGRRFAVREAADGFTVEWDLEAVIRRAGP